MPLPSLKAGGSEYGIQGAGFDFLRFMVACCESPSGERRKPLGVSGSLFAGWITTGFAERSV